MTIQIHQTLHGYERGHQLLAQSLELSADDRTTLLYLSDLSGPNVDSDFKTYLTGYPLLKAKLYAFSRTWYADEMARPGCVWTHTLLINFSDLGKIPEFDCFLGMFRRPVERQYESYSKAVEIDFSELFRESYDADPDGDNVDSIYQIYVEPTKSIILPTQTPTQFERPILSMWSNQWPRLRRNFLFCTGALSIRKLDQREFDLQVVPQKNLSLLQRSSSNLSVSSILEGHYKELLQRVFSQKIKAREFLWTFGADVPGDRANFLPLIRLYDSLSSNSLSIKEIFEILKGLSPSIEQGIQLKSSLLKNGALFPGKFSEKELVSYIINNGISFYDVVELDLEERVGILLETGRLSSNEFLALWESADRSLLSEGIWSKVDLSTFELSKVWEDHPELISTFIRQSPGLAYNSNVWGASSHIQQEVLRALQDFKTTNWEPVLIAIADASSDVVYKAIDFIGSTISAQIIWSHFNSNNKNFNFQYYSRIATTYEANFVNWIYQYQDSLSEQIFDLVFHSFSHRFIQNLNLAANNWINGYNLLKARGVLEDTVYYASCLLAKGFDNRIEDSHLLVKTTFHDVYSFAAGSKLDYRTWSLIPKDEIEEDEDELDLIRTIISILGLAFPKKKNQVPNWDYCEYLIRTLSTKYIRHYWPKQVFLDTLTNEGAFRRAISYLVGFKKGRKFLAALKSDSDNGGLKIAPFQKEIILKLSDNKR